MSGHEKCIAPACRRICIVGSCGAGKTTLARRMARVLGVRLTSVDDLLFADNWRRVPHHEVRRRLMEVARQERWVIEGKPSRIWRDFLRFATCIVWLDFSRWVRFSRLCRRTLRQVFHGETCCGGNTESFLTGVSFLWRATRLDAQERSRTFGDLCGTPQIRICTSAEENDLLQWFENSINNAR